MAKWWRMIHDHSEPQDCCILGCDELAIVEDIMDNPFCESCAEQNHEEEPDNWDDE